MSEKAARHGFYQQGDVFQMLVAINWLRAGAGLADKNWRKLYDLPLAWPRPVFPLKGEDLLAFGLKPGPLVGKKLRQLESDWIDSDFTLSGADLLERL
jgi:tRNA nucleotidyltransferase/poly(A) polymerase